MTIGNRQPLVALEGANEKRFAMVTVRHELGGLRHREGCALVAGILDGEQEREAAESMPIWRLLNSITKLGPSGAERMLIRAGVISGDRRVRELTNRQRVALAAQLRGDDPS